jgi:hypothetical protein
MPQCDLVRTEFFNDFLARDGLHWGVNLYAWVGDQNIGDMRIWRDRRHENFSSDDLQLLDLMRPVFTAAFDAASVPPPALWPAAQVLRSRRHASVRHCFLRANWKSRSSHPADSVTRRSRGVYGFPCRRCERISVMRSERWESTTA